MFAAAGVRAPRLPAAAQRPSGSSIARRDVAVLRRGYKSNFNSYIAQRGRQLYVPKDTVVVPRQFQEPPAAYESFETMTQKQKSEEWRLLLQKTIRQPLEVPLPSAEDLGVEDIHREPGDEEMPQHRLRRHAGVELGEEEFDDVDYIPPFVAEDFEPDDELEEELARQKAADEARAAGKSEEEIKAAMKAAVEALTAQRKQEERLDEEEEDEDGKKPGERPVETRVEEEEEDDDEENDLDITMEEELVPDLSKVDGIDPAVLQNLQNLKKLIDKNNLLSEHIAEDILLDPASEGNESGPAFMAAGVPSLRDLPLTGEQQEAYLKQLIKEFRHLPKQHAKLAARLEAESISPEGYADLVTRESGLPEHEPSAAASRADGELEGDELADPALSQLDGMQRMVEREMAKVPLPDFASAAADLVASFSSPDVDPPTIEEIAEARIENAFQAGNLVRAAEQTSVLLNHSEVPSADWEHEVDEALDQAENTPDEKELDDQLRNFIWTQSALKALADPTGAGSNNVFVAAAREGNEDFVRRLKEWATSQEEEEDLGDDELEVKMGSEAQLDFWTALRSCVARGYLSRDEAMRFADNPIEFLYNMVSPKKMELLQAHYLPEEFQAQDRMTSFRPNATELDSDMVFGNLASRKPEFSNHTLHEFQRALRDIQIALRNTTMTIEAKAKIKAGVEANLSDIDIALVSRQRGVYATGAERRLLASRIQELADGWFTPDDDVTLIPPDMLMAPTEQAPFLPNTWEDIGERELPTPPEGHVTRARMDFRKRGELAYARYADWRELSTDFVASKISREKNRQRMAKGLPPLTE